jgi:hypothetical protein
VTRNGSSRRNREASSATTDHRQPTTPLEIIASRGFIVTRTWPPLSIACPSIGYWRLISPRRIRSECARAIRPNEQARAFNRARARASVLPRDSSTEIGVQRRRRRQTLALIVAVQKRLEATLGFRSQPSSARPTATAQALSDERRILSPDVGDGFVESLEGVREKHTLAYLDDHPEVEDLVSRALYAEECGVDLPTQEEFAAHGVDDSDIAYWRAREQWALASNLIVTLRRQRPVLMPGSRGAHSRGRPTPRRRRQVRRSSSRARSPGRSDPSEPPLDRRRCGSCGGWCSQRCVLCRGNPELSIESIARGVTQVHRATGGWS